MPAVRQLVTDRLRLLRLLAVAGPVHMTLLVVFHLAAASVPVFSALALGHVVGVLADPMSGRSAIVAAAGVGVLLFANEVNTMALDLVRGRVSQRVDGWVRGTVRHTALAPDSIEHLETADFQNDSARAVDPGSGLGRTRSAGTAAVGQLMLVFRVLAALGAAAVLAAFFPVLAGGLVAASLVTRAILRRQWTSLAGVLDTGVDHQRRVMYLSDLAIRGATREVRYFGLADFLAGRFKAAAFAGTAPAWRQQWRVLRRQWWIVGLIAGSAVAALAVPGAAALHGRISPEQLMICVVAAGGIFALMSMGQEAFDIEYGLHAVRAVDRLTDRYGAVRTADRGAVRPGTGRPPLVRFEGVTFTYPGAARPVFQDLDLTVRPGESLAVVGENGAGKTTLVKLLAGLYRPTAGRIVVDGQDLAELDLTAWRRRLTVLFQDFVRYPESLRDNITLAAPEGECDDRLVVDAIDRAAAGRLLAELPHGLDTLLWPEGDGGVDLSGGQWQRVAIARTLFAVATGRHVVVLDEPTAHLDMRAEAEFYERVVRAAGNVTTVLVSHRLSTVRPADRIVLLGGGRVAEAGSHDELMALGGRYRQFFSLQAAAFAAEVPCGPDGG